jgi:ferredoxin
MVTVNAETCDGCEECVNICPNEVLEMADDKATVNGDAECDNCESCIGVCPSDSITITEM